MRVAITGASGFIGRKVAEQLLADGHKVFSYGRTDPKIKNVTHKSEWETDKKINAIVHCASRQDDWTGSKEEDDELIGTNNSLTLNALSINPKARLIFLSDDAVYQYNEKSFECNETPIDNNVKYTSTYALSKASSEAIIEKERTNGDYYILRASTVYGDGDRTFLPRLESRGHGALILPGRKKPVSSFLNVNTLVKVILFFVNDYKGEHFGIYNVADKDPVDTHATILSILANRGKPNRLFRVPFSLAYKAAEGVEKSSRKKGTVPYLTRMLVLEWGRDNVIDVGKISSVVDFEIPPTDISNASEWNTVT